MNEKADKAAADPFFGNWLQTMTALWETALPKWPSNLKGPLAAQAAAPKGRVAESWQAWLNTAQSLYGAMGRPENLEALTEALQMTPEIVGKISQIAMAGFDSFQKQFVKRLERVDQAIKPFDFQELDKEFVNLWSDLYEKEIRQYFKAPQLGLTRQYQEKTLAAADKYNLLQSRLAEFFQLLNLPIEKSFRVLNEQLQQQAAGGQISDDPKQHYQQWIKILEGHYMTLFKSAEYTEALGRTIGALSDYWIARREVLQDALGVLTIPTYTEMNELYKELHEIKQELKVLKKQVQTQAKKR
jgi:class III poly(R)-hydroxyalkanoic acid synthase PhaE subunit